VYGKPPSIFNIIQEKEGILILRIEIYGMNPIKRNKIQKSLKDTKERRNSMTCKVIECKVVLNSIPISTKQQLNKLFLESKWLYNNIIASEDISKFNTKITQVSVKVKDSFEQRNLEQISAQMKQGIHTRVFNSLSTLKALKQKGFKVGKLKFKSEINCIPLKQHTQTFTILKSSKRIKIQGIKSSFKVNGLNQLPKNYEIANANLVKNGKDFYVKITIYTSKENLIVPNQSIGIDFGCETQLTLSNGEKICYQVPISKRLKTLDKQLSKKQKCSSNRIKCKEKRQKEYLNLTNKRKEIKNQIVNKLVKNYQIICFQDENLNAWKQNGHGKKVQFSAMGGIISALQRKAVTPIVVEKWYPSTQICSNCGNRQKMDKRERVYLCKSCGATFDRDINASINIKREGLNIKNKIPTERREFKPVEMRTAGQNSFTNFEQVQSKKQETPTSLVLG
jgi:putative transposase